MGGWFDYLRMLIGWKASEPVSVAATAHLAEGVLFVYPRAEGILYIQDRAEGEVTLQSRAEGTLV